MYVIEGLLRDHWHVRALVQFAALEKRAIIKGIAEHPCDRVKAWRLLVPPPAKVRLCDLPLNGGQRVGAFGKTLQNALNRVKMLWVRFDGAEPGFVVISEWGLARKDASPVFLTDTALYVHRKVPDVLICHSKFDRHSKDIVVGEIALFKGSDLLDYTTLKKADDPAGVVEIASQPVELPR
ncbi:MAG TPA: hypothetical protein VGY56_05300 [Verrucomicrobiae bacterium]|nr:hypothetical protein [Verrucomicrobiae bacterium]